MKKLNRTTAVSKRLLGFAAAGASLAAIGAHAQTIISDNFNEYGTGNAYGSGGTLVGVTPDVANLPGGTWQQANGYTWAVPAIQGQGWYSNPFSESIANTQANGTGFGISIASNGSYVEPSQLSISADLSIETNGQALAQNVLDLGFYAAGTTFSAYSYPIPNFTGLSIDEAGDLTLLVNGAAVGSPVAYVGTFNPAALSTLSYDVNTTAGTISNISFQGSTADYSSLEGGSGLFSASNIAYAGVYASGGPNDNGSATGNFVVAGAAVPEPGTYAMLASGVLALGAYQYRRRH